MFRQASRRQTEASNKTFIGIFKQKKQNKSRLLMAIQEGFWLSNKIIKV